MQSYSVIIKVMLLNVYLIDFESSKYIPWIDTHIYTPITSTMWICSIRMDWCATCVCKANIIMYLLQRDN